MGDRKNAAADRIHYCEMAYIESKNPYYVVAALDAARWGDFPPPDWALEVLLDANSAAMRKHDETGERISIDTALELSPERGHRAPENIAKREIIERSALMLSKTILACFEVSIPDACEITFYAIDHQFALDWQETADYFSVGVKWQPSWCDFWTHDEWEMQQTERDEQFERVVATSGECLAVQEELLKREWWGISRGTRLNYSLDHFIDRYYRIGTKMRVPSGQASESQRLFIKGGLLLLTPAECSSEIRARKAGDGYVLEGVSSLKNLKMREDFQELHQRLSKHDGGTGPK